MQKYLKSLILSLGLLVSFTGIVQNKNYSSLYKGLINEPILILLAFCGGIYFFKWVESLDFKTSFLQKLVSLLFAICTWFMTIYNHGIDTVNKVIYSSVGILYSIFFLLAFYFLIESAQIILTFYYQKEAIDTIHSERKILSLFEKHSLIMPFLMIGMIWILVALSAYPSVFMGDSLDQLTQFFGLSTRTAAHPVGSTLFIGGFVKLGKLIGHPNYGLFLYTIVQVTFVAFCLSYAIHVSYKLTKNRVLLFAITVILAIIPMGNSTVILATKDIMFTGFFVLFMITLIAYFYDKTYYNKHKLSIINFVSVVFMLIFRYNTFQFIGLTIAVYILGGLLMRKKFYKIGSVTTMMILGLIVGNLGNTLLSNTFAQEQLTPKRREMLSVPFQQTARYAKYHDSEVTKKEKEIINKVLDYDVIKKEYNPSRSDSVKRTHNEDATSEEMKEYFVVVKNQSVKHPLLALESLAASHSNLFNLNNNVNGYYENGIILGEDGNQRERAKEIGIGDSKRSLSLNRMRIKLYRVFDRLPILSQLDNYGFYVFIMLAVFVLWIRYRNFYFAGIVIPMGALLGTLIAGPITLGYIRYILPIVFTAPFLLVFCLNKNEPTDVEQ